MESDIMISALKPVTNLIKSNRLDFEVKRLIGSS